MPGCAANNAGSRALCALQYLHCTPSGHDDYSTIDTRLCPDQHDQAALHQGRQEQPGPEASLLPTFATTLWNLARGQAGACETAGCAPVCTSVREAASGRTCCACTHEAPLEDSAARMHRRQCEVRQTASFKQAVQRVQPASQNLLRVSRPWRCGGCRRVERCPVRALSPALA
jgi:hypothetical protein